MQLDYGLVDKTQHEIEEILRKGLGDDPEYQEHLAALRRQLGRLDVEEKRGPWHAS